MDSGARARYRTLGVVYYSLFFNNCRISYRLRVQPARGWFSNTKVISQSALQKFQDEMGNIKKVIIIIN